MTRWAAMLPILAPVALALAGCVTHDPPHADSGGTCDARAARPMIGQPATDRLIRRARRATGAAAARVLRPGTMVTMDFHPGRLNLRVNERNIITDVICG